MLVVNVSRFDWRAALVKRQPCRLPGSGQDQHTICRQSRLIAGKDQRFVEIGQG